MSAFWDGMAEGNAAAIETMGEEVQMDGLPVTAIVEPQSFTDGAAAGGRRTIISCQLLVAGEVAVRDGMPVQVRGADGKVASWELIGPVGAAGHRLVRIGPFNRWEGGIPGL